ncbi:MAG: hypothetical protein TU36_003070 [Vulcanisaeta sp. AZ3]|jgi:hypothetical protein
MRKGLLIVGIVLIVLAVVIFFLGIYLSTSFTQSVTSLVTKARSEATLTPDSSIHISNVSSGETLMIIYNDTLEKPLETVTTAPGGLKIAFIYGQYMVAYVPVSSVGSLSLVNNYSEPVTVYYTYSVASFSSLAPLLFSMAIVFVMGIAGIILAVLGAVLKSK